MNLKFGKEIISADLKVEGGYKPGMNEPKVSTLWSLDDH
jgi:hypothetical protein